MYTSVAKAIRENPTIDTLSVYHMTHCADLILQDSPKAYSINLEFCHGNSTALLLRPKIVRFFRLRNHEPQNLKKNWPSGIWDSLEHLDPGHENNNTMRTSLKKYLDQGRRPALKSLDLSDMFSDELAPWLALVRKLELGAFTYVPYEEEVEFRTLKDILAVIPKVRTLSIKLPPPDNEDYDSDEEESDEEDEDFELKIDSDIVNLLAGLADLERLTLVVDFDDIDEEDTAEAGQSAVEYLAVECRLLRCVRLVYNCEDMDKCVEQPVIVEYKIRRLGGLQVVVESVPPRLLEGTVLEFVEWR